MRKIITGRGAGHRPASGDKSRCLWTGGRQRQAGRSTNIAALAVALAVLAIAGCGTMTKTPAPAGTGPAALASTKAVPSPSNSLSGPVGTVYTVTGQSGGKMSVTLTKVIDPAPGADQFNTAGNGNRFVGAVFTITGISGTLSDDANNDATLIGSNGQTYSADFDSIAGYTNFNNGEYNVSAKYPGPTAPAGTARASATVLENVSCKTPGMSAGVLPCTIL